MSRSKPSLKRRLKLRKRLSRLEAKNGHGVYLWVRAGIGNPIGNGGRKP